MCAMHARLARLVTRVVPACWVWWLQVEFVQRAMGHSGTAPEEYLDTWRAVHKDLMWVPAKGRYDRVASATPAERVESTKVWVVVVVPTCWAL